MTTEPNKFKPVHAALGVFTIIFIVGIALTVKNRSLAQDFEKGNFISNVMSLNERIRYYRRHFPDAEIIVNRELKDKDMMKVTLTEIPLFEEESGDDFEFFRCTWLSDKHKNLYLGDFSRGVIRKYDTSGKLVRTIGRAGQGPGEFAPGNFYPFFSVTQDSLLIVDGGNRRLTFFTSDGRYIDSKPLEDISDTALSRPTLLGKDRIILSFLNETLDNVIHIYDFEGKRIHSFGVPMLFTNSMHHSERTNKRNYSNGIAVFTNNHIFFSQAKPYGIQIYNQDGVLTKKIFRDNDFMLPSRVIRYGAYGYEYRAKSFVWYFGLYENMLVNFTLVPEYKNIGCRGVLDFFTKDGRLSATIQFAKGALVHLIDTDGNIWIEEEKETGEPLLKKYKITIEKNPA